MDQLPNAVRLKQERLTPEILPAFLLSFLGGEQSGVVVLDGFGGVGLFSDVEILFTVRASVIVKLKDGNNILM